MAIDTDGQDDDAAIIAARRRLAEKIAALRHDANMSQREAALRAGINQATWSRLEGVKHDPSLGHVLRVQRLFGLDSIESFFGPGASARILAGENPDGSDQEQPT